MDRRLYRRQPQGLLALRELEPLACTRLAGLFTFLHARVTREQALFLQRRSCACIDLKQSPGNAQTHSSRLTSHPAANRLYFNVEAIRCFGYFKRLQHGQLQGRRREIFLECTAVDRDFPGTPLQANLGYSGFTTASGGINFRHKQRFLVGRDRLLRGVRVFLTLVNLEFREKAAAEPGVGDHAFDGMFNQKFRPTLATLLDRLRLVTAYVP